MLQCFFGEREDIYDIRFFSVIFCRRFWGPRLRKCFFPIFLEIKALLEETNYATLLFYRTVTFELKMREIDFFNMCFSNLDQTVDLKNPKFRVTRDI
jgi:hypothetical protein